MPIFQLFIFTEGARNLVLDPEKFSPVRLADTQECGA